MKAVILFILFFVISVYSQETGHFKSQTISLEALNDTSDNFLSNQPFGDKSNSNFKLSIRTGKILINDHLYKCAIYNTGNEKNYNYSFLWIDTLVNDKYDFWKDFLEEIWVPFTLFGKSYKVTDVDSSGNYFKVMECDSKEYPPVQVGMKAPNIEFTSIKNENISLYAINCKYKVLFFWGCNPIMPAREMKKVINNIRLKDPNHNIEFINSSWEPFEDDKKGYPWIHFYNRPSDELRQKYQVGSLHKLFVLDEENNILLIWRDYPSSGKITEAIEKIIPL